MRRFLIASTLLAAASSAAQAQIAWQAANNGNWNDPARWIGGNVPDSAGETAQIAVAGTYIVDYNQSFQIGGLDLSNPTATLNILPNLTFAINAPALTNNGTIVLNSSGSPLSTAFRSDSGSLVLNGNGTIRLNADPSSLDTAQMNTNNGGFVITNSASHNIKGCGRVRIAMTNLGLIEADQAGEGLDLGQIGKANSGTLRASSGGTLSVSGITLDNSGGQMVATGTGSLLYFGGASITGGTISTVSGGLSRTGNSTFSNVTFSGAHNVDENTVMAIGGAGLTNNGLITVNPTAGTLATYLRTDVATPTLGGTGTVRLNAHSSNPDTAQMNTPNGGFVLTNGPDHSIRGTGSIRVPVVNNGLISADQAGLTLLLMQANKTNNDMIEAVSGGALTINGITLANSATGVVRADGPGSTVNSVNAGVTGGTSSATGGGVVNVSNATYSDVTLNGPHRVIANTTMALNGTGITNNGTITVNHDGSALATYLRTDAAAILLGGTGTVRLAAQPANVDTAQLNTPNGNFVLTIGSQQTVSGTGAIRVATVNDGTIDANDPNQVLSLRQAGKTNNNVMRATNGGALNVEGIGVTNNAGISAVGAGSSVNWINSGLTGGQLSATGGGLGRAINSTFADATVSGPLEVPTNTFLAIAGSGITNNGTITVNPTSENLASYLRLDVLAGTLGGSGTVRLRAHPSNVDTAQLATPNGNFVLTIGSGQTVAGCGSIRVDTVNQGLIHADINGQTLALRQQSKTNNATIRASGGGTISVEGISVAQGPSGVFRADGVGSAVSYGTSTITGGQSIAAGGVCHIGNSTFNGVTLSGEHRVSTNTVMAITGSGLINNGLVIVNSTGDNLATYFRADAMDTQVGGAGAVQLNAHLSNLDTAQLATPNGNYELTFGPNQMLSGNGAIRVQFNADGILSPGSDAARIGRLEQRQFTLTQSSTSLYQVDVAGTAAGQYDSIGCVGPAVVAGVVNVTTINGFQPERGDEFPILTASSRTGQFDNVTGPFIDAGTVYRVRYTPTAAILSITCPGDINGDHFIELPDLATVLANFGVSSGAGGNDGDANGDGAVNLTDLAIVLAGFGSPCP